MYALEEGAALAGLALRRRHRSFALVITVHSTRQAERQGPPVCLAIRLQTCADRAVREADHVWPLGPATFFWQVAADSMREAGILDSEILAVNHALRPPTDASSWHLSMGICVKLLHKCAEAVKLVPAKPTFLEIISRGSAAHDPRRRHLDHQEVHEVIDNSSDDAPREFTAKIDALHARHHARPCCRKSLQMRQRTRTHIAAPYMTLTRPSV